MAPLQCYVNKSPVKTREDIRCEEGASKMEVRAPLNMVFGERRGFKCSVCSEGHGSVCLSSLHPVLFYDKQSRYLRPGAPL